MAVGDERVHHRAHARDVVHVHPVLRQVGREPAEAGEGDAVVGEEAGPLVLHAGLRQDHRVHGVPGDEVLEHAEGVVAAVGEHQHLVVDVGAGLHQGEQEVQGEALRAVQLLAEDVVAELHRAPRAQGLRGAVGPVAQRPHGAGDLLVGRGGVVLVAAVDDVGHGLPRHARGGGHVHDADAPPALVRTASGHRSTSRTGHHPPR
ncbi:hypothetical protein GCM10009634_54830 [Saccharothrix xinjiangensis]